MTTLEGQLSLGEECLYGYEDFEIHICEAEYIGRIGNSKLFITGWDHCYDIWLGATKETAKYIGRVYGSYKFSFRSVPYAEGEKRRVWFYNALKTLKKSDIKIFNRSQKICTLKIDRRRKTIQFLLP